MAADRDLIAEGQQADDVVGWQRLAGKWRDKAGDRLAELYVMHDVLEHALARVAELEAWQINAKLTLAEDKRYIDQANSGELVQRLAGERDDARSEREALRSRLHAARALHFQYRAPAMDEFHCCAECNRVSSGYAPWPCATYKALTDEEMQP